MRHPAPIVPLLVCGLVWLAGCTAPAPASPSPSETTAHSHGSGPEHITPLVGDGTRHTEFGYSLERLRLPERAGVPGTVSFQIRFGGRPVTDYIAEQTKDLHLYVVRSDLGVFRHLHPSLGPDGTWTAPVTLPAGGRYRVIAELVARVDADSGEAVMLGRSGTVRGASGPAARPEPGGVTAEIEGGLRVGPQERLTVVVRHPDGGPVQLGDYLGTAAHVTAFDRDTGRLTHLHPLGAPIMDAGGTRLSFHTQVMQPGRYLCFVQVRVDGFLHTLRVETTAG